ncbi:diaminopimelate decarboxylase [Jeotgalicoccus sp. ATCC 8456]|uniref:diaminopimelate decarboxylase n=1 Tax=Jeotgalicoccus sp. ATCC 8456 TaxID=946435 RepID=UPI0018E5CD51|nr:diaminopimelate decarboxylase [Jeotgalicoccus sp. ATCC 8456]QQD85365.1 diaminopimelate decarboxylase [Jeotgalicoccus sp. ATCC 8456]
MTTEYENGQLMMRGHKIADLAKEYGTPLIIYDEDKMTSMMNQYHQIFKCHQVPYSIPYASKAFSSIQMIKLLKRQEMELDVVSVGELYTAIEAGFPVEDIHFHGNNKTPFEIDYAIKAGVRFFIIDAIDEIGLINELAKDLSETDRINVLIRINPSVEVNTHEYISTGQEDSKFGLSLSNGAAKTAIDLIQKSDHLSFKGLHYHLGSQLSESRPFINAITNVFTWLDEEDINIEILNMGGGYGVKYTQDDVRFPIESGFDEILTHLKETLEASNRPVPHLMIEPGRSITAEAGLTVYEVGTIKNIHGISKYVSIDGGMSDHIRTPLYGAEYEVIPVKLRDDNAQVSTHVVGKLCESGDVIGKHKMLPHDLKRGDLLAVKSTGAYHYSMASNYNQMQKPAVIFVSDSGVREVIRRQSLPQLIENDVR